MFISFEGVDSSGKSTQIKKLYDHLTAVNIPCVLTKEPGGCDSANKIRSLLLENDCFSAMSQLLLINASRVENVEKVIKPALKEGKIVLCDRFVDSTIVYQAQKAGLGIDIVKLIHKTLFDDFLPDLTLYLHITKTTAIKRIMAKKTSLFTHDEHNWIDEGVEKQISQMIEWFNSITTNDPFFGMRSFVKVDANPLPDKVFHDILRTIGEKNNKLKF